MIFRKGDRVRVKKGKNIPFGGKEGTVISAFAHTVCVYDWELPFAYSYVVDVGYVKDAIYWESELELLEEKGEKDG